MFGRDIDTLNVYVDYYFADGFKQFNRELLWKKTGTQSNTWLHASATISTSAAYKIVFEGVIGKLYDGHIALDDVLTSQGMCISESRACDFSVNFCGYTNSELSLKWKRSAYDDAIPIADHTTGTVLHGSFAYVNMANANSETIKVGRLVSPVLELSNSVECLEFWYLTTGTSTGTLNVYLSKKANKTVWHTDRNKDDDWRYVQIQMDPANTVNIVFEAVRGNGPDRLIGIDDINMRIGSCLPPVNCNFEENTLCSWTQSKYDDDFDWLITRPDEV
jgi:hypothetical protein